MLKNIRFHIEQDECKQISLEAEKASLIQTNISESTFALRRYIPSLVPVLKENKNSHISLFCNKYEELNIVDYLSGRVLYGLQPNHEIDSQFRHFTSHALALDHVSGQCNVEAFPQSCEVVVVLGLGLGLHLHELVHKHHVKHIIVYEPQEEYFRCAVSYKSWQSLLETAQETGTALYLQIGKDARELKSDLEELQTAIQYKKCFFYKHYNYPTFDVILSQLKSAGQVGLSNLPLDSFLNANTKVPLPRWNTPLAISNWSMVTSRIEKFEKNLKAFEKFFPEIYEEFKGYEAQNWQPKINEEEQINLFHIDTDVNFYGESPRCECTEHFSGFSQYPNKDGLILGYKGKKLKDFIHYKMVVNTENILDNIEEKESELPTNIKSLIVFGIGIGYQIEKLLENHTVEKLFICEPNKDFFFGSLFAIDWNHILEQIDNNGGRLYINLGDDGTYLFEDLLIQFQTVGPYILSNTYFYQGYYNEQLASSISQLREQLQVLIAMGDYFDHARFGIAHTRWGIFNGTPFMREKPHQFLSTQNKNVPVFIVGNGPSLDNLIDAIHEYKEQVIIVSCGTALQTLHRNNIVPDFHAEIETNRATFDWAVRVGDLDYLKQITLISCNGIHPDTCELYKDVLLAFKEGESATVCVQELDKAFPFAQLRFAYPTVTNFVVDFLAKLNFQQLYLLGVDLGFVDVKQHHSKDSGYYRNDGHEQYDYQKQNNTTLIVPGNFRKKVHTKYEFKVAKDVLEQSLANCSEVYNLNDGAKISSARPLKKDDLLILSEASDKKNCIDNIKKFVFTPFDVEAFSRKFAGRYHHDALLQELKMLRELADKELCSRKDVEQLIEAQRTLLVATYTNNKSLLFFYMNGSLNFINSALSKVVAINDENSLIKYTNEMMTFWREMLKSVYSTLSEEPYAYDFISTFTHQRQKIYLSQLAKKYPKVFFTPDAEIAPALRKVITSNEFYSTTSEIEQSECIILKDFHKAKKLSLELSQNIYYLHTDIKIDNAVLNEGGRVVTIYLPNHIANEDMPASCNIIRACTVAVQNAHLSIPGSIMVPKIQLDKMNQDIDHVFDFSIFENSYVYQTTDYMLITQAPVSELNKVAANGDRLTMVTEFDKDSLIKSELCIEKQNQLRFRVNAIFSEYKNNEF